MRKTGKQKTFQAMKSLVLHPHEITGLLDGTVTVLMRPVKPQPHISMHDGHPCGFGWKANDGQTELARWQSELDFCRELSRYSTYSPFGPPGTQLWCKETWGWDIETGKLIFRATPQEGMFASRWYLPNSLRLESSRITLETVDVKVKRCQEVNLGEMVKVGMIKHLYEMTPAKAALRELVSIRMFPEWYSERYGPESWDRNDFLWVATVKKVKP